MIPIKKNPELTQFILACMQYVHLNYMDKPEKKFKIGFFNKLYDALFEDSWIYVRQGLIFPATINDKISMSVWISTSHTKVVYHESSMGAVVSAVAAVVAVVVEVVEFIVDVVEVAFVVL